MIVDPDYEYAGFHYTITRDDDGVLSAKANDGQHRAAKKDKHLRAAVESWQQDHDKPISVTTPLSEVREKFIREVAEDNKRLRRWLTAIHHKAQETEIKDMAQAALNGEPLPKPQLTETEKAMMWERMSGERLPDAERERILQGGEFVKPS